MILVDSSVMIDALRRPDAKLQNLFNTWQPVICGIVVAEVLHGARDAGHYSSLVQALASFPLVTMPDAIWENVGRNLWTLRTRGVTVPFQDVVIATVAMENQAELWTRDAQFQLIQTTLSTEAFPGAAVSEVGCLKGG